MNGRTFSQNPHKRGKKKTQRFVLNNKHITAHTCGHQTHPLIHKPLCAGGHTHRHTRIRTNMRTSVYTHIIIIIIIIINPLTARVVGAPQMILQPVFSIFPCSPLPSGTCRTPGLAIPRCCPPTSSSFCLVLSSSPFTVPCKMVLARPDEQET